jgi:threonine dehydrogenase-like Zn-dependent dehydrogenase
MMTLFDKQIQLRMGQANVKRWVNDLLPLVSGDTDPLGVEDLATHYLPLSQAAYGYRIFNAKSDGAIKVLLQPGLG